MASYNFENLDPSAFEEFVIALGTEYIGNGLMPFGAGPDGGREATFRGKMDYPSGNNFWDGYLVMQCKQKQTLGVTPKADADWAIKQLDKEMKMYQDAVEPRTIPDYYIFVTNVVLSPPAKTGGKDRFLEKLNGWASKLKIKGVDVWDRDKLSSLLNGKQDIAKRYGYLHAGDLIHQIVEQALAQRESVKTTISVFLEAELRADQYVRLTQAGYVGDEQTPLARVFVDLQADIDDDEDDKFYVVKAVQEVSNCSLRPSIIEEDRRQNTGRPNVQYATIPIWDDPSRFVVIGGPGQGKSTLAQHLAQRHRAALLKLESFKKLNRDTPDILRVIENSANKSGIGLPTHTRIPFRVILEQFADALYKKEVFSVLDYIAYIIRKRTTRSFSTEDAEWLLQTTPWFIAFDGLDEVPAVSNRTEVLNAVNLFLSAARVMDADILVFATTRPQGYDKEFDPSHFNHLRLTPLTTEEALTYAQKFADIKYSANLEQRDRIMKRLRAAASEEATARLMESPLQVTIMAALVDVVGNPPRERYPLFNRYYDIVYQREQERGLELSSVLADYRGPINKIHDHIALTLQIEAEKEGNAQGRISQEHLEKLIYDQLVKDGYKGQRLESIQKSIFKVALHRLVFIAPLEDGRFGFEVRSLQEFAAARALMKGKYDKVKKRLTTIAPVPYWRNTTLFAIGRAFAEQNDEQCDMITQLCRELNSVKTDLVLAKTLAGSRLALDILTDGVVDRQPKYRDLFLEMALELLTVLHVDVAGQIAEQYTQEDEEIFSESIRKAIATTAPNISTTIFMTLVHLLNKDKNIKWADKVLENIWPKDLSEAREI
ncbi:MAG: hypothetical protein EOO61_04995, partial [Hymenobacter sp.]